MDSNFQYAGTVYLVVASLCRSMAWDGSARRSGVTAIAGTGIGQSGQQTEKARPSRQKARSSKSLEDADLTNASRNSKFESTPLQRRVDEPSVPQLRTVAHP
jgi:hypothetical protein